MTRFFSILTLILVFAAPAVGQNSVDLMVDGVGLSIGDSKEVTGLRLNFRDRAMRRVTGINATLWLPYKNHGGDVHGIALGLPATGADNITGLGYGWIAVAANEDAKGIISGGIAAGAGNDIIGIASGGLGVGAGRDIKGIATGGLGAGAGRDLEGLAVGGLGVGAGNDVTGVVVGGLGAGAGNDMTGIAVSGLGAGAGRDFTGIAVSGLGTGAGRDFTGISVSGLGTGAGRTLTGIHVAGLGVGGTNVRGLLISGFAAGGHDVYALSIAPAYFKVDRGGEMRGLSVSSYNRIQGEQKGVTIGILNYARKLSGYQIGLINVASNKKRFRIMPFFNFAR